MGLNQALNLSLTKPVNRVLVKHEFSLKAPVKLRVVPLLRLTKPELVMKNQRAQWPVLVMIAGLHVLLLLWFLQAPVAVVAPEPEPIMVSMITLASKSQQTEVTSKPVPIQALSKPQPKSQQVKPVAEVKPATDLPVVTKTVETTADQPRYEATTQAVPAVESVKPAEPVTVVVPPAPAKVAEKEDPVEPPKFGVAYLNNPAPEYPRMSKRAGEEGRVLMKVLVSVDGLPVSVELAKSSGFERLDAAAVAAVKQWRFEPARKAGKAISASVMVPLSFSLN